ncbi:hypothetical protein ACJJTC_011490 [Scirpophaga incertulas]
MPKIVAPRSTHLTLILRAPTSRLCGSDSSETQISRPGGPRVRSETTSSLKEEENPPPPYTAGLLAESGCRFWRISKSHTQDRHGPPPDASPAETGKDAAKNSQDAIRVARQPGRGRGRIQDTDPNTDSNPDPRGRHRNRNRAPRKQRTRSASAAVASLDCTGKPASRNGEGKAGPQKPSERATETATQTRKPQTPHLAVRRGTTATIPAATTKKTVTAKTTSTPPGVPQNTPITPATTIPARNKPISRSQTEMYPPKPQQQRHRSRSRQSERSARSDRSNETTPERSGPHPTLKPPLSEPRALVSTPTPGFGPSAPTPFASSSATTATSETPRTYKRAHEEGDSDKAKPAVRPKIHLSPASQAAETTTQDANLLPSTSYAEQVKATRIVKNKNDADQPSNTAERQQSCARGEGRAATTKADSHYYSSSASRHKAAHCSPAPETDSDRCPSTTTTTTTTLTHEPVVAALQKGRRRSRRRKAQRMMPCEMCCWGYCRRLP